MGKPTIKCPLCEMNITTNNYKSHIRRHEIHPESFIESKYKITHDGLICQFCSKVCKNSNSLCNHERLCKSNPNRQLTTFEKYGPTFGFNNKGRTSNRKGLSAETDESVRRMIDTKRHNIEVGKTVIKGHPHSDSTKKLLSEIAISRNFGGTNRRKTFLYNGIVLESSYELIVAKELDNNNIKWSRPSRFYYFDKDGKRHHYTPDFYLPEYDVYLDPKNDYLINSVNPYTKYRDIDKITWVMEQHKIIVLILDKNNLGWNKIKAKIDDVSTSNESHHVVV